MREQDDDDLRHKPKILTLWICPCWRRECGYKVFES